MMFDFLINPFLSCEGKRKRLLKKAPDGPIKNFLSIPFPDPKIPINETPILAVDFETTGLNVKKDDILSVGFIGMANNDILLSDSYHQIVHTQKKLNEENVIVHHITDQVKSQGQKLEAVIEDLLSALAGKVMLAHYAHIERNFLQAACIKLYGIAPVYPVIDTFAIAQQRLERYGGAISPSALRLFNLREQHKLPQYKAHNALSDALATAELLLAEIEIKCLPQAPLLKSLISR